MLAITLLNSGSGNMNPSVILIGKFVEELFYSLFILVLK